MKIIHDPEEFQAITLRWRREGLTSALVPTMGALHDGHFRLVEEARARADRVSVSIFLNPIQFGAGEDLDKYPRTFEADCEGCRQRGVDVIFAPRPAAMYPEGFQTHVEVEKLTQSLCGANRPGHFQGVTTVVLKLFMLAQPSVAVFGWKDAQQFLVLRRMVRDLSVPVELIGVETVREADGLARSSRNAYLTVEERAVAPVIYQALCRAREAVSGGQTDAAEIVRAVAGQIEATGRMAIDYAEARSMETLELLETVQPGGTLVAVAAQVGKTRLIDNIRL